MKAQILKIAGVKSEKEFYKKFPSEEAFMKVHGKAFKKAQTSNAVEKAWGGWGSSYPTPPNWINAGNTFNPGNTNLPAGGISAPNAQAFANQSFQTSDPFALNNKVGKLWATNNQLPAGVTDKSVPEDIGFTPQYSAKGEGLGSFTDMLPGIGAVVGAFNAWDAQKDAVKKARQDKAVSDVQVKASATRPEPIERKYVRPEDALTSANQVFPTLGVGTNVLKRNGGDVPKAQVGTATRADSLAVFNNAVALNKHYDNLRKKGFYETPGKSSLYYLKQIHSPLEEQLGLEELKKKTLKYYRDAFKKDPATHGDWEDFKRTYPNKTEVDYKKGLAKSLKETKSGNKNKYYYKDIYPSQIDPLAPSTLIDTRIAPQYLINYVASLQNRPPAGGSITGMYGYDPLAVKPFDLLTDDEKKLRVQKYGTDGVPPSYITKTKTKTDTKTDTKTNDIVERPDVKSLENKLRPAGLVGSDVNLDPILPTIRPTARPIDSYDVNYSGTRMDGSDAYYANDIQNVDQETALRAMQQADAQNAYWQNKYGNSKNPKAIERLNTLRDNVTITPRYQSGGEIQNTYAPGMLYDDLGYEPLNDSSMVKAYRYGGGVPQAESGFSDFMSAGGGDIANQLVGYAFPNSAGQQIGTAVGNLIPLPGAGAVLGLAGGLLDQNPREISRLNKETQRNQERIMLNQKLPSIQAGYASHMKDGGWVSHDWQPQVITQFGDHSMKKLLAPDETMDTLRSGGHIRGGYTQPSARALETMALGGQVKTTWGGHAETISQNPYMPGTGETIMFRGKSHDESDGNGHTGIGVKYGDGGHDSYTDYAEFGSQNADADVEVERNEPAFEMMDPQTGEKNLTVLGNLKFDKKIAAQTGDQDIIALSNKYNGKKFKNIGDIISKQEAKENKVIADSTAKLNALNVNNSFDKLTLAALTANIQGANAKLKGYAADKTNLATFQNAINDASEEHYLDADNLAQGKGKVNKEAINEAKNGTMLNKAQKGKKQPPTTVKGTGDKWDYTTIGPNQSNPEWQTEQAYYNQWAPKVDEALNDSKRAKQILNYIKTYSGPNAAKVKASLSKFPTEKAQLDFLRTQAKNKEISDIHYLLDAGIQSTMPKAKAATTNQTPAAAAAVEDNEYEVIPYERNKWVDAFGQILPFFRPTDQEGLDPRQLSGEMYALTNNLVDPVQAQTYQPELSSPYDISLQDQMNEITAQTRAAQRMVQGNPEAQAMIASTAYDAINKVKGEEFRANQAMKDKVYGENRNALNEAKLKNLAIYDQQYQRQSQAVSNTKEATQAALNSIADKYGRNKLENRTLGIYENLYNYRYDNAGRAINMNAPQQFTMPYIYGPNGEITHIAQKDAEGNIIGYTQIKKKGAAATTTAQTTTAPVATTNNTPAKTTPTTTTGLTTTLYSPIDDEDDSFGLAAGKGKNGKKLKVAAKNGSIVRAIKNL